MPGTVRFMCLLSFAGQRCVFFYNLFSRSKIMEKSQKRLSISAGERNSPAAKARSLCCCCQWKPRRMKSELHISPFSDTNTPRRTQTNARFNIEIYAPLTYSLAAHAPCCDNVPYLLLNLHFGND